MLEEHNTVFYWDYNDRSMCVELCPHILYYHPVSDFKGHRFSMHVQPP
jgi:hypothetical protein